MSSTLDRLVAEKVMGWHPQTWKEMGQPDRDGLTGYWATPDGKHTERSEDCDDYYQPESAWSPSTDMNAAMEVEAHVVTLARYFNAIVPHCYQGGQKGVCLLETYTGHLWRIVGGEGYEKTCMGDNNWAMIGRTRIATLYALAHATPEQRCLAALAAVGVEYKESDNG